MKILNKFDIILIIFLVILSFVPYFIFIKFIHVNYHSTYARIIVNGELYDNIPLSSNRGTNTFTITTNEGSNTVSFNNNSISILKADCLDSLCIKQGTISKIGENLICLPHKLIIEIKGEESDDSEDIILSH